MTPFVIFGMPRSRTHWLSRFLSYGGYSCEHDIVARFRAMDDVKSWLAQDWTGAVETAAAPWWRLLTKYRPDARVVVVIRPVADVVASFMRLDMQGVATFEREPLMAATRKTEAKLRQIAKRVSGALVVSFDELAAEDGCRRVFEHCLGLPFDKAWWEAFSGVNLQCSVPAQMRYFMAHKPQIERMRAIASQTILTDFAMREPIPSDGLDIRVEPFGEFYRDGVDVFREHLASIGEHPETYCDKSIPLYHALEAAGNLQVTVARQNGRIFGYLMTVESPSLEKEGERIGAQSLRYASPLFPGLGLKMQRAAIANSKRRGLSEIISRAGTRGSGARVASIYRRCGSFEDGQMFRHNLREA